ncbi:MAG TPA: arginine deiminase family protein [Tepidisphaeraceae bacterium]|nr:arginine deiminase family protein [Tepidisphaeraceae bacterium]
MLAITHIPSPAMQQCELTFLARAPIDYALAVEQHEQYCRMLGRCGAAVKVLDANRQMPDCCFVEDTALVLDELAIMMSMGAAARRGERPAIESELRKHRNVSRIETPALIDGGDILQVDRKLLVGLSSRTNAAGAAALQAIVEPHGYTVTAVPVLRCLHVKSACTALPDGRLLVNPNWIDVTALCGRDLVSVPPEEPAAANVRSIGQTVCLPVAFPRTAELIARRGFAVETIDLSEFAKAEGGVTCLSLLISWM